jgi:DNA invertase Pin-like site-specific DNA recombinase
MSTPSTQYIAYYRVSTQEQGRSGLGLEAQRQAVLSFTNYAPESILASYTDISSGKNNDRPELGNAIEHAKRVGAKLLIAKLDRLSRNASFIFTLRDTKVDFVCCDMPDANTLTIGIFATLAQHERELISQRTKAALAAKKKTGWKAGTPENLTYAHRLKGAEAMKKKAQMNEHNRKAAGYIKVLRESGKTLQDIANVLNDEGFRTARGKVFSRIQVKRIYDKTKINYSGRTSST